jgi:hypothetical protein
MPLHDLAGTLRRWVGSFARFESDQRNRSHPPPSQHPARAEKKVKRKKRKPEKAKPVRARRRTIDPTKWDSQHLKGVFLDSIIVADDDDNPPVTAPSQSHPPGDQEGSGLSSDKEQDQEEEEGNESDSSEHEAVAEGFPTISGASSSQPPPTTLTEHNTADMDHDFNEEKLRALSLLDSMFGGLEGDQQWGGKEALDSDIDIPELPSVQTSPSMRSPPSQGVPKGPDLRPAVEEVQEELESEESSAEAPPSAPERALTSRTVENANTTKAKLKDLFAPQEEQGALLFARNL